jgi:two-component system cell cycle response regulator
MDPLSVDPDQTKLMSMFSTRMGEQRGYLVRIHPVVIGDGVITLPDKTIALGRDSDCDLVLADHDISRRHAQIEYANGEHIVRDLGSTNGTIVNNKRVQFATLSSGDTIRVGKTILKFLRGNDIEKQYHETVYSMMVNDGLTGIPNKRYLQEVIGRELIRSQRHNRPLAIAVLDIDHFKAVNDKFGHLAGDAVLRELANRIKGVIRKDELFARYGGEEFVVVMPEATLEQAGAFAERIRALVAGAPMEVDGSPFPVTVSIGVAATVGDSGLTVEQFFERADKNLYQAKSSGRNRVIW